MPHPLVPIRSVFFKKLYLHKQTYNHPGVFIFLKKLYLQADLKPTASAHAREFLFTEAMESDSEAPVSYIHLHTHIYSVQWLFAPFICFILLVVIHFFVEFVVFSCKHCTANVI